MTQLHELKPHPRYKKKRKRVGRGPGSGVGKTSGRGHKGQRARGPGPRPGFEGGQMPLMRILPKRGFSARGKVKYQIINVGTLEKITDTNVFDVKILAEKRIISSKRVPVKVLGHGEVTRALELKVHAASNSALDKITKAGGKIETIG